MVKQTNTTNTASTASVAQIADPVQPVPVKVEKDFGHPHHSPPSACPSDRISNTATAVKENDMEKQSADITTRLEAVRLAEGQFIFSWKMPSGNTLWSAPNAPLATGGTFWTGKEGDAPLHPFVLRHLDGGPEDTAPLVFVTRPEHRTMDLAALEAHIAREGFLQGAPAVRILENEEPGGFLVSVVAILPDLPAWAPLAERIKIGRRAAQKGIFSFPLRDGISVTVMPDSLGAGGRQFWEEIRPHVMRLHVEGIATEDMPLVYIVRPNHEEDDIADLDAHIERNGLRQDAAVIPLWELWDRSDWEKWGCTHVSYVAYLSTASDVKGEGAQASGND